MSQKRGGGVSQTHFPFFPVVIGVFSPSQARPIRASGTGDDGSDPPFFAAGAARRWGGCTTGCQARCHTPYGVAPVICIPAGRLRRPPVGATRARRMCGLGLGSKGAPRPLARPQGATHPGVDLGMASRKGTFWPREKGPPFLSCGGRRDVAGRSGATGGHVATSAIAVAPPVSRGTRGCVWRP